MIVTENARDFRALAARTEIHPGMIILPCVDRHTAKQLIRTAVAHLGGMGSPGDVMVNRVLEIDEQGQIVIYDLPKA